MLRIRMSGIYTTVRQAFLALDSDHDGFITIEDFLRQFGDDKSLNFNDLKKLINSKDKQGLGKLSYEDFSAWVGNSIHKSEGFYFRHDSIKNPGYEKALKKIDEKQAF
jgi:hypothetical protein